MKAKKEMKMSGILSANVNTAPALLGQTQLFAMIAGTVFIADKVRGE